jgi:hypothetical protein
MSFWDRKIETLPKELAGFDFVDGDIEMVQFLVAETVS